MPPPLAPPARYLTVAAITGLVAALAGTGGVHFGGAAGTAFLGAAVLLTGMPHGAVDHLVAQRLFDLRGPRGAGLFYGAYLAAAALYGLVWLVAPAGALALFLLMAAYHFGQADLAYLAPRSRGARTGLYLSRGAFVVGGAPAAHPQAVAPLVEAVGEFAPLEAAPMLAEAPSIMLAGLAAQHALVLAVRAGTEGSGRSLRWMGREACSLVLLTVLFGAAPPLVGFAVYFGLWHALGHVFVLLRFFRAAGAEGERSYPVTGAAFYRRAAAYTVLPLVGLVAFVGLTAPPGRMLPPMLDALAALFVLISVLTLPHMLLVERLYRRERERTKKRPREE